MGFPKKLATDPVTAGPWPFGEVVGYLGGAPIHGRFSRGGGTALALRGNSSCGPRVGMRLGRVRRGSGSGDMEGPRTAGNAYAVKGIHVQHDLSDPPFTRQIARLVCAISMLSVTGKTAK